MARREKALVIGDDTRSFLAIVRSLGRQGIEVHAAPFDFSSPSLKSRYVTGFHYLPYYMGDGSEWLNAITSLLERGSFDLVVPCDERSILPLQRHRPLLSRLARLAMPDDKSIDGLFDKHETRKLAQSLGVPVAPGGPFEAPLQGAEIIQQLGLPIFIKPRRSYSLDALYKRAKVIVANSQDELDTETTRRDAPPQIFEQLFEGRGVGVSVLASCGRILQYFEHHRVREIGGSSYYRVSAPVNPELARACSNMMAALDYTGVAMFEFRVNDTSGKWILLEINARPWGSLPLPVALGVDFPYRWFELLVHGKETVPCAYEVGIYGRNLLPDMREIKTAASEAWPGGSAAIKAMGKELVRIFAGRERHDLFVSDDPAPALHEIGVAAAGAAERVGRGLPCSGFVRRAIAADRLKRAVSGHRKPLKIVFLCHGNICRSPFAAGMLERAMSDLEVDRVEITSAGILPRADRSPPAEAIQAARHFGVDLSAHKSRHLDRALAEAAQVIFVFDEKNRVALAQRYPNLRAPILSLALFSRVPALEDPDGKQPEAFSSVYRQIEYGVHALAQQLKVVLGAHSSSERLIGTEPECTPSNDPA